MPFIDLGCGCNKVLSKERVVSIDKVAIAPDKYKSFFGIEGMVTSIDKSKRIFLLGCEDTCIIMPVRYKGKIPKLKSKIIVYGEIKKQKNGKYIFDGKEVKIK